MIAAGNGGPRHHRHARRRGRGADRRRGRRADTLAEFSSRGPRAATAGSSPRSPRPASTSSRPARSTRRRLRARTRHERHLDGDPARRGRRRAVAAAHPDWTAQQLKEALVSTAKSTPAYTAYEAGSGRVDAAAAVDATVFATASAEFGFHTLAVRPGRAVEAGHVHEPGRRAGRPRLAIDGTAPAGFLACRRAGHRARARHGLGDAHGRPLAAARGGGPQRHGRRDGRRRDGAGPHPDGRDPRGAAPGADGHRDG